MKIYNDLTELEIDAEASVLNEIKRIYDENGILNDETFEEALGGPVEIIETLDELARIETLTISPIEIEAYLSLLHAPAVFDVAEWLPENDFAIFLLISNNSGGTTYFIPRAIAEQCANVQKSIDMTKEDKC